MGQPQGEDWRGRPGVWRQGARFGSIGCIGCLTFVAIAAVITIIVFAVFVHQANRAINPPDSSTPSQPAPESTPSQSAPAETAPDPAGGTISCLEARCTQGGREVEYWVQGKSCGDGKEWGDAGTDPKTHAGLWACETPDQAQRNFERESAG
jgi:hypothetical protein